MLLNNLYIIIVILLFTVLNDSFQGQGQGQGFIFEI